MVDDEAGRSLDGGVGAVDRRDVAVVGTPFVGRQIAYRVPAPLTFVVLDRGVARDGAGHDGGKVEGGRDRRAGELGRDRPRRVVARSRLQVVHPARVDVTGDHDRVPMRRSVERVDESLLCRAVAVPLVEVEDGISASGYE